MARNSNIKLRRSATQGSIPTTSNLDLGELAINTYDGKLYVKKTFGSLDRVVQVGSSSYSYNLFTGVNETLIVTVAASTADHRYNGTGSSNKYFINGLPSPYLKLVPGTTYRFDQSDSSNSGHPLLFYYEAAKTTSYSTGVTTNGTPGSSGAYTQIIATDSTPPVLHYQCSAHANMGNQATFSTRNLTGFDTDDLTEGSTNLYYTDARADARIAAADTDDLSEGSTNLYYTDARARGAISVTDAGGDGSLAYNNSTGVITYTGPSASEVRAHFSAGTGVTISSGSIAIGQAVATTSDVQFNDLQVDGNTIITGNLTVNGTSTTLNVATLDVEDLNITIASGATTSAATNNAGLTFGSWSSGTIPTLKWIHSNNRFSFNKTVAANIVGNVTGALTGNADTATALATARNISGVSFDGTADITLNTSAITENTNLYYTNARADARIAAASLLDLSDVGSDGTNGQVLTTDGSGGFTFTTVSSSGGTVTEAFKTLAVSGQSDVVADSATDTLTFAAGSGMSITTDASTDTITFTSSGGSTQSAVYKEYVYVATNAQTSFSGSDDNSNTLSYTPLFLQVFLNGVLLDNGTDYTATNGTAVVLVNGATTSDLLQISTFVQIIGSADAVTDEFTGDGSTVAYTLTADPDVEGNTMVFVDGVYQEKATYSVSGTTLTFSAAPANGQSIEVNTGSRNVTVDDVSGLTIEGNLVVEGNTTLGNASSDTITVTGTPTFAEAVDINSTLNVSGHVSLDGTANELRFYEGSNYVGFEAPTLSADQIWVLPTADGTSGYALKTDGSGNLSWGLAGGNAYETIAVSGQSSIVASSSTDTLTVAAGAGITLTTNAGTDTLTITNSSLGANAFQNIAVSGQTTVAADSTGDTVTFVGTNGIDITTVAGTDTVTFDGNKSVNPFVTDLFTTANASTTAFTLSTTPSTEDNLIVFVEGVYQNKNSYVLSGTTLTLDGAPASASEVVVHIIGDGVVGGGHTVNGFTGDNSTTDFTLTLAPMNENNTLVYLDGVYQHKSEYSVSGTTLTFSTAPGSGDDIEVLIPTLTEINQPATGSIDDSAMFDNTVIIPNEVTATTVASTSASTIATHAIATYRTVKYLVQCTQGTDYHSTEINVIHDGTTAYMTEYGTLFDNAALGTFDVAVSGGNLLLQITAGSATSMAVKVISTAIPV